jgi:hemolysin III
LKNSKPYQGEELVNAITHGLGAGLSIAALVLLVVFASIYGSAWHIVSFSIYGTTLILLYLSSTLYHSFRNERVKYLFKIFDHSAIFLCIAGTYTPFTLITLRGALGWTIFGIVWGLAALGIVFKVFLVNKYKILSTIVYILMGWLVIIAIKPLLIPYSHAIWHLFVLAGSICQFFSIFYYLLQWRG